MTIVYTDQVKLKRSAMRNWAIRWKLQDRKRCKAESADCLKRAIEWRDASMSGGAR